MPVFVTGLNEAGIVAKKADDFAAPRTDASGEGLEISPGEGTDPAPVAAENVA